MGSLIELIIKALPYPNQISDIEFEENEAVRFKWREVRYRVSTTHHVEEVGNGVLAGTDRAILIEALIHKASLQG